MLRNLLILLIGFHIFSTSQAFGDEVSDEKILRHFKTVLWPQAYRTQDVKLLDRMLHPSFEMLDNSGTRSTKAKELDFIKNNKWNPKNFSYTIERLKIYGGQFAVIDGTGKSDTYSYKSSNYLIKENGTWQAVGSHVSGFKVLTDTN